MNSPAINVIGLTVIRGARTVLHGMDFTIPPGAVTGLLGPSGCGKTTLMRAMVGVQQVSPAQSRSCSDRPPARRLRRASATSPRSRRSTPT